MDIWFERVVKPRCQGKATIYRYADDFVYAFQYKADAERFYHELGERVRKFGLELSKEKTNIIRFSRYPRGKEKRFEFPGYEFGRGTSRNGKRIVKRRTSPEKVRMGGGKNNRMVQNNKTHESETKIQTVKCKIKRTLQLLWGNRKLQKYKPILLHSNK